MFLVKFGVAIGFAERLLQDFYPIPRGIANRYAAQRQSAEIIPSRYAARGVAMI